MFSKFMNFIADNMLGKLAKYLRLMGYDTFYSNKILNDDEILEIAKKEDRILITRDRDLALRYNKSYLLNSTDSINQLREIVKAFNLNTQKMMTRCSICNTELVKVNKTDVKGKVPEKVYENFNCFYFCPTCGRYYWYGTHAKNIEKTLKMVEMDEYSGN